MLYNLLDISKSYLKNNLLNKASAFLDEDIDFIKKASDLIIPTLFGGIIEKCETDDVNEIYNQIKYSSFNSIKTFENIFKGNNSLIFDESQKLLTSIFDDKVSDLALLLSKNSKLHKESSNSLLKMILPIIVKTIGEKIKLNSLSVQQFHELINSQKNFIAKSVTADYMNTIVDTFELDSLNDKNGIKNTYPQNNNKNFRNLAVLSVVLVSLLGLFFYLNTTHTNKKESLTDSITNTAKQKITSNNTIDDLNVFFNPSKEHLGKYIKNYEFLGSFIEKKLKNGTSIIVLSNDGESKLVDFIESDSPVDKKAWFDFRRIAVNKITGFINDKSSAQIHNIVKILKAYPNVNLKIGGYTDNQGSPIKNFDTSYRFAEEVTREILKYNIDISRIRYEGYGENYPTSDNDTEYGKKLNQRIAIRVSKK